ncbi:MAG: tyrosine-type recombinase/integrase [Acidimicrobiia bacterium]
MAGHVRKRGNSWELIAYAGRDPLTGRKRYVTRSFKGTKRAAEQAVARLVTEVDDGNHRTASGSAGDLLERWFEVASPEWSPVTVRQHRSVLDRHLLPRFGETPLRRLRAVDIDSFYAELRKRGRAGGKPLAAGTVLRIHAVLRSALEQARKWGWLTVNPADLATPPRAPGAAINPPEPADLGRLFALVDDAEPELGCFLRLAASTGARRSQVCGLRWSDVDLGAAAVTFARGVVDGPDGLVVKDTKTHRSYAVALDEPLVALLEEHHARMAERAIACGVALVDDAYVFSYEPDCRAPWRPDGVTHRFSRLRAKAGMPGVRLHDLRHYVATRLLAAGVPITTVAGRLGHARSATTLNVYGHFAPSDRDAAKVLSGLFDASAASSGSTAPTERGP